MIVVASTSLGLSIALLYQIFNASPYMATGYGTHAMDFFETQERYRRREMRGWVRLFTRIVVVGGVLWVGWLWGQAEQASLKAEADLVIYQNNIQITQLSNEIQGLKKALAESKAAVLTNAASNASGERLRSLIVKKIAGGVSPEQISQSIQRLGKPVNCRVLESHDVSVATPIYAGQESKLTLFNGGLNLFVEGKEDRKSRRNITIFDPAQPLSVRLAFLGGEKLLSGTLPFDAVIPGDSWVLLLHFEQVELLGYIKVTIKSCVPR